MSQGVHLITYADRLAGDLPGLHTLLTAGPLAVFSGVHVLPFFVPFDGADAGFDPVDHASVDPRLGSWSDVAVLAADGLDVTADLIVNHVSSDSAEFTDWLRRGDGSASAGMFLTYDTVFPGGGTEAEITAFHRPRPGLPFTPYRLADGSRALVWTTFLPTQVDLDVRHPAAQAYLRKVLRTLAAAGVRTVRLDAVGYAVKTPGTDGFMTRQTLDFVAEITALARGEGLRCSSRCTRTTATSRPSPRWSTSSTTSRCRLCCCTASAPARWTGWTGGCRSGRPMPSPCSTPMTASE